MYEPNYLVSLHHQRHGASTWSPCWLQSSYGDHPTRQCQLPHPEYQQLTHALIRVLQVQPKITEGNENKSFEFYITILNPGPENT